MVGDNSWVVGMWLHLVCSSLVLMIDALFSNYMYSAKGILSKEKKCKSMQDT